MAKVLKADGSAAQAYVNFHFASAPTEVWLTARMAFDTAALSRWTADTSQDLFWVGTYLGTTDAAALIQSGDWVLQTGGGPQDFPAAPTSDAWHTVEFHYIDDGTTNLYVDSTLVSTHTSSHTDDPPSFAVGLNSGGASPDPDAADIVYFDDVKAGTTRGASDLFSDDFESGTLAAWTHTVGSVSVVDDPFPSAPPAPDPGGGVYIAFDDDTLTASPTWTRLDDPNGYDLVQGWSTDRGRSSELDKTQTGTATIKFRDTAGILDPTNASGPFYGKLDPMRQVKIDLHDPIANADTTVFRGFASEWLYDLDLSEVVQTVTLECADAFDLFAALELTPGQHGDSTGLSDFADVWFKGTPSNVPDVAAVFRHVDDSIMDVLDNMGWPGSGVARGGPRDIFSGNVSVQGSVYARRDQGLQALQDRADAEFPGVANVYMSKAGVVRARGRLSRFNPTNPGYGIGSWSCGDTIAVSGSTAIAPISGLSYRRSKNDVINSVLALPQGVVDTDVPGALVNDSVSIATYGWRAISFNDLLVSAGHTDATPTTALEETEKFASYYVDNYKDPKTRVQTISFRPRTTGTNADKLWLLICGVEIGDLLHLTTNHPGGGGFDEDFFVEGIRYDAQMGGPVVHDVTMELDVSPRSFFTSNPFGTVDDGV